MATELARYIFFIVMPLTLPLAAGYFIYHTVKWRQMRRQAP